MSSPKMGFTRLSELVHQLRTHRPGQTPGADFRSRAGSLAVNTYGTRALELPELVNVAALALSFGARLVVHELSGGVIGAVDATDLHSLPGEPPRLLRGAWLLESRKPTEPLFGASVCLGGYPFEGALYLVGLDYPDGARVASWRPAWGEREIDIPEDDSPLIADISRGKHAAWAREAARFALVFAILIEAEGTPVRIETEGESSARAKRAARRGFPQEWGVRYVSLSRPQRRAAGESQGNEKLAPGYIAQEQTPVAGHLKRQPFGPGRQERKWVYIAGYQARRWVAPNIRIRWKE